MAYLSLYRKYRSQSFAEISGQEHVTRTLGNAIRTGRVGHAYLFCGPRGTGKTSIARLLAKCLNCAQAPTLTPCSTCPSCVEINAGITGASFNVQEFDAASKRSIDDIRHLRETIGTGRWGPAEENRGRKVVIIDEVHMLTTEAFNALLKTLEEPPEHVLFVLATTDAHKVPATIVSRCQRFDFRRGSMEQIKERLRFVAEQEDFEIEEEAVERIARGAGGSWRDALSLLEQVLAYGSDRIAATDVTAVLGTVEEEQLAELAGAVAAGDGGALFALVDRLIGDGRDIRQLARDLTEYFRQLLLVAVGGVPKESAAPEQLRLAAQLGVARLVPALEQLSATEREFRESDQLRLILEVTLVRIAHLAGDRQLRPALAPAAAEPRATAPEPRPAEAARPRPSESVPASAPETMGGRGSRRAEAPDGAAPNGAAEAAPSASQSQSEPPRDGREPPAESLPPPRSERPAGGPPAEVDLETIRRRWGVLVEELRRRRRRSTAELVREALPVRLDGETLALAFEYETHVQLMQRPDNQKQLEDALADLFGTRLRVVGEVARAAPATAAVPEPRESPRPVAPPRTPAPDGNGAAPVDNSRLVHEVIELFDGTILEEDET